MMHFLNDAEVVHHTPERTRIRIPGRRGDAAWFTGACQRINQLEGVTSARHSRHNGTIVIGHASGFALEGITGALHGATLAVPRQTQDVAEIGGDYFPEDGRRVRRHAGEIAAMILQLAVAVLFGTALTHVLELVAKNLFHAAVRELGSKLEQDWTAA